MCNIDPSLGTDSAEDRNSGVSGVGVHNRDGPIKGSCPRGEVFENIGIIQTIGVAEEGVFAGSGWQIKRGGVLGDAVNMAVMREIDVEG
jgi:hypothetical protein